MALFLWGIHIHFISKENGYSTLHLLDTSPMFKSCGSLQRQTQFVDSVTKVLAIQAGGSEFYPQNPLLKCQA